MLWIFWVLGLFVLVSNVSAIPNGRVVNGSDSAIERFPFMVSLRSVGYHFCGGSIIAPNFVLTAAHCTYGELVSEMTVQYGVTKITVNGSNVVRVKRYIEHKDYEHWGSYNNDIALVEVEQPFKIDYKTVAPVKLPKLNFETAQTPIGSSGALAGWGYIYDSGYIVEHLQEVDLKIYSDRECSERHHGDVSKNQICGGVDEGGKGQCSGDSGGPLLYTEANELTQVGIVSWSNKPCTIAPYPGVYTKVANYVDWIMHSMIISN